jgi:cell division septation protein DedD
MTDEPQSAYLPHSDQEPLQPFDVRDHSGRKGMFMLVGGLICLAVLLVIVMKLFASGTRGRDQTPRIMASNEPYKEVPLDRGGVQTPNQDKEIYDVLKGTTKPETVTVSPPPEEPVQRPQIKVSEQPASANVVIKEPNSTSTAGTQNSTQAPTQQIKTPPAQKPKPVIRPQVSGDYVVQVASLRSRAEANTAWNELQAGFNDVVTAQYYADIKRVDLDSKGIYYRLRVSGSADKIAAKKMCTRLKARGQDCIVTKR